MRKVIGRRRGKERKYVRKIIGRRRVEEFERKEGRKEKRGRRGE